MSVPTPRTRLPAPGPVQHQLDRLARRCTELAIRAKALADLYEEAYAASLSPSGNGEMPTLGRGFSESDPTGNTAANARLHQLRWRAKQAASSIDRAMRSFDEAEDFLKSGFTLAFDEAEFARWLEKKLAAEG